MYEEENYMQFSFFGMLDRFIPISPILMDYLG